MDVSTEYMKMCFMADEYLRPLYKFEKGDWIFSPADDFKPKVLSDYGIFVSNNYALVDIAFPEPSISKAMSESAPIPTMTNVIDKVDFRRIPEPLWYRLHRQDQLQNFFTVLKEKTLSLVGRFKGFLIRPIFDKTAPYNIDIITQSSMEQLWLMFVMYERFGKVWNGTEWKAVD